MDRRPSWKSPKMKMPREISSSLRAAPEMATQTVGRMSGPLYWKQSQEPNHPHASENSQGHQARGYHPVNRVEDHGQLQSRPTPHSPKPRVHETLRRPTGRRRRYLWEQPGSTQRGQKPGYTVPGLPAEPGTATGNPTSSPLPEQRSDPRPPLHRARPVRLR